MSRLQDFLNASLHHRIGDLEIETLQQWFPDKLHHRIGDLENY